MKPNCFVIMPFSATSELKTDEYWTKHYEKFIEPILLDIHDMNVFRSSPVRGDIIKEIIFNLVNSEIVIADLTDLNANVFWELGVRQSFKNGTITIVEAGSKLPFDISTKGTLFYYPSDHIKNEGFKKQLRIAIMDCINNKDFQDSFVLEAIGGRGTLYQVLKKEENINKLKSIIHEIEKNDFYFNKIIKCLTDNNSMYPSVRLGKVCSEHLITNRYLNESDKFYDQLYIYTDWITSINEHLEEIKDGKSQAISWILKNKEVFVDISKAHLIKVNSNLKYLEEKI